MAMLLSQNSLNETLLERAITASTMTRFCNYSPPACTSLVINVIRLSVSLLGIRVFADFIDGLQLLKIVLEYAYFLHV